MKRIKMHQPTVKLSAFLTLDNVRQIGQARFA